MATKTIITTYLTGQTLYWFPFSRSLADWTTYRVLAVEASAPDLGKYQATLDTANVNLTLDPEARFVLFDGASQPGNFSESLQIASVGTFSSSSDSTGYSTTVGYSMASERVGHYLFGQRSAFSADQQADINDCVHDGLRRVYAAYNWSFLRPVADVSTTAPYATGTIAIAAGVVTLTGGTFPTWAADGVLKVNDRYYSVASRGSGTQITLDSTSVTVTAGASYQLARPEIPLADAFDSVANDSDLNYYPSPDTWYPPVQLRHDSTIRQLEGNNPEFDRPAFYSVRTTTFDASIGSRKVLVLYPTPDQVYTLRVPMILRPVLMDATHLYAIGGEMLSQVILEAALAAAETNFEEREHVHQRRYMELIELAIRDDQERSSPTSLGRDAPRGERGGSSVVDYQYRMRQQRIGSVSLDGLDF